MRRIYLDHAATTPMRTEVVEAMLPYFRDAFGNASSMHAWGRAARNALETARERIAASLGARRAEIVFTGGGTEADNLAILGRWRWVCRESGGPAGAIVCSAVEHKAVGSAAEFAAAEGAELILIGVDETGRVEVGSVVEALKAGPCLVSVMWGNNEVGTIQPVADVGRRCREAGVAFHTDAVQALGKVRIRVDETPCDLLAASGHKIGGPKGIGFLYVREGIALAPLTHGGGQERALRPGTENVAAAVGLAEAVELATGDVAAETQRLAALRDRLEAGLRARIPDLMVNGASAARLPHVLSVTVPGADAEALLIALDLEGVAASGASACASGSARPSHVLVAMGRSEAGASIRLSLGHTTTRADIDFAIDVVPAVVAQIRPARQPA